MKSFQNYKKLVDKELKHIFNSLALEVKSGQIPKELYNAISYSVFNGGKRIRPVLCLASYSACCRKTNNQQLRTILPFACGLEFIHTFSLIQDDLPCMDNDDYRRGKLSLHRKFNEAMALLAADALFAWAFELFAKAPVGDRRKITAILELLKICGANGLVSGQVLDIIEKKQETRSKKLELKNELKTAALIAGSVKIGAIVAGAPKNTIKKVEKAGTYLGLLFQTTDDMLDTLGLDIKLKEQAQKYSAAAKKIFHNLGKNFDWFITFTEYILERKQ